MLGSAATLRIPLIALASFVITSFVVARVRDHVGQEVSHLIGMIWLLVFPPIVLIVNMAYHHGKRAGRQAPLVLNGE